MDTQEEFNSNLNIHPQHEHNSEPVHGIFFFTVFTSELCRYVYIFIYPHIILFIHLGHSRTKDASDEVRKQIYQTLLAKSNNGRLGKNVTREVASQFSLHIRTVQKIWKRGKQSLAQGIVVDVTSRKKVCTGRKATPIDLEPLRNIPLNERMTLEAVSKHLNVSKTKLIRYMRQGHLRRHSNSIKPFLTEANKNTRLKWCLDMLEPDSFPTDPRFNDLFDHVFIDEKWFFLTQKSIKYYLLPDEDDHNVLAKVRITFHALCFWASQLDQGFKVVFVFLMGKLDVSHLSLTNGLKGVVSIDKLGRGR
ncbi:hypothetical protein PR202_gb20934 [Eleusine coracana subsp. coracana]|uniref:DUF7769 domain-containing protein n=1 Tax=Eleusine coracana subsp. coracana TaxID=191504 RepID=A0AAV5FDH4_ELECO|nr:hypothetical protein PR202_gb20934 [Eleusine coracana subsp. coracana]